MSPWPGSSILVAKKLLLLLLPVLWNGWMSYLIIYFLHFNRLLCSPVFMCHIIFLFNCCTCAASVYCSNSVYAALLAGPLLKKRFLISTWLRKGLHWKQTSHRESNNVSAKFLHRISVFLHTGRDLNRADTHVVLQPGCLSRSIAGATLSMTRWPKKATTKRFMGKEKTLNADICQVAFSLSSSAAPSRPMTSLAWPRSRWVLSPAHKQKHERARWWQAWPSDRFVSSPPAD